MTVHTIPIDPMIPKQDYDATVKRGVDTVEWVAPAGVLFQVRIVSPRPFHCGPPAGRCSFVPANHARFPQSNLGETELDYEIEVFYPAGNMIIDPIVKIQP